jgi:hypothetical protein
LLADVHKFLDRRASIFGLPCISFWIAVHQFLDRRASIFGLLWFNFFIAINKLVLVKKESSRQGEVLNYIFPRELVRYTHFFLLVTFYFFFSFNFCHHGSIGAAVDSPRSQQDPYLSPQKRF